MDLERQRRPALVRIPTDQGDLEGEFVMPARALGVVLFAHGSGSSRKSPRNQGVARRLERARLGTLLFDLLTHEEERIDAVTGHLRFDIELLAERLVLATRWLLQRPDMRERRVGYFGASTGAAAALVASTSFPDELTAVVSRGGRPDLASSALERVTASTLLIVGGADIVVLDLNQRALERLQCTKRLEIIPGATHLFEEPGALESVADLASRWFVRFFTGA